MDIPLVGDDPGDVPRCKIAEPSARNVRRGSVRLSEYPDLAVQFAVDLNGGLTPDMVLAGTGRKFVVAVPRRRRPHLGSHRQRQGRRTRLPVLCGGSVVEAGAVVDRGTCCRPRLGHDHDPDTAGTSPGIVGRCSVPDRHGHRRV